MKRMELSFLFVVFVGNVSLVFKIMSLNLNS